MMVRFLKIAPRVPLEPREPLLPWFLAAAGWIAFLLAILLK
jgi:hypothetical protein